MRTKRKYYVYRWVDDYQTPAKVFWGVRWKQTCCSIDLLPCTVLSKPGLLLIEAVNAKEAMKEGKRVYNS